MSAQVEAGQEWRTARGYVVKVVEVRMSGYLVYTLGETGRWYVDRYTFERDFTLLSPACGSGCDE